MEALEDAMYEFAPREYWIREGGNNTFPRQTFAVVVANGSIMMRYQVSSGNMDGLGTIGFPVS